MKVVKIGDRAKFGTDIVIGEKLDFTHYQHNSHIFANPEGAHWYRTSIPGYIHCSPINYNVGDELIVGALYAQIKNVEIRRGDL